MVKEDLVLSVLVRDDSTERIQEIQEFLKEIESGWSVEFHTAEDRETFQAALDQQEFHVVFLKQELEGDRTGLEVLEDLRGSGYQRPVVLTVEDGDQELAARAFRRGINDYLPVDSLSPEELKRSIEYVLKNYFQYDKDETETEKLLLFERRDSLTGFYNRVSLVNQLDDRLRKTQNMVLFLVGLANLERVNETHGQEVGDRVIKQLGNEIGGFFDEDETIGRVQGGDFCVLLEGKGSGYAQEQAQSFLGHLKNKRFDFDRRNNTPLNFIGCVVPKDGDASDGHDFLCRGVDKLHKAKAGEHDARVEPEEVSTG